MLAFAGLSMPRRVHTFLKRPLARRLADFRTYSTMYGKPTRSPCGPYTFQRDAGTGEVTFYLESDFMPDMRWRWADQVVRSIRHMGWFIDLEGQGDTVRGLVMALPHGQGWLAGWSMGVGMISEVDRHVYPDETGAALAADSMAERVAERERALQAEDFKDS